MQVKEIGCSFTVIFDWVINFLDDFVVCERSTIYRDVVYSQFRIYFVCLKRNKKVESCDFWNRLDQIPCCKMRFFFSLLIYFHVFVCMAPHKRRIILYFNFTEQSSQRGCLVISVFDINPSLIFPYLSLKL